MVTKKIRYEDIKSAIDELSVMMMSEKNTNKINKLGRIKHILSRELDFI